MTQVSASHSPYLSLSDFLEFIPASRSTVGYWIKRGDFPPALPLPSRRRLWYKSEIEAWLKNHGLPSLPPHLSDKEKA